MTGTLVHLAAALSAFVGGHVVLSSGPVRARLVFTLGARSFQGLYSLIAVTTLLWVLWAYADAPYEMWWQPHTAFRHLPMTVMALALF